MRVPILLVNSAVLICFCDIALAETYQTELNAGLTNTQHPFSDNTDSWLLSGTYYFNSVDVKDHPLAEAAFLERSGNLKLMYIYEQRDVDVTVGAYIPSSDPFASSSPFTTVSEAHQTNGIAGATIEVYVPDTIFYVSASYEQLRYKLHIPQKGIFQAFDESYISNGWSANLGITPVAGLRVWSEFYEDQDVKDDWNLQAKYVMEWNGNAINIEGGYQHQKDFTDIYSLGSDFYFDRSFSVGATCDYNGGTNRNAYGIRSRKFFSENVSLQASYTQSKQADIYNIGVAWRI